MRRSWTLLDFILIWLAGAGMSLWAAAVANSLDLALDVSVLLTLAGQFLGSLIVFAVIYLRRRQEDPLRFGLTPGDIKYALLGIGLQIVANILMRPIAELVYPDDAGPPQEIADIIGNADFGDTTRVALFVSAALLAPFVEELLYRGVLFKAMRPRGPWVAILTTAFVFAGVHVTGLDPENMAGSAAIALPPLFALAILLGWVTERTGRLGPAFFIHSGWNFIAGIILLIPPELIEDLATG